ncbi:MAG: hypothetical protein NT027_16075 [Proteobacteria bacterium]|nr:hypothetical protein [Pseudomonadota bacterium]
MTSPKATWFKTAMFNNSKALAFIMVLGIGMIYLKDQGLLPFVDGPNETDSQGSSEVSSDGKNVETRSNEKSRSKFFGLAQLTREFLAESSSKTEHIPSDEYQSLMEKVRNLVDRGEAQAAALLLEEALLSNPTDAALLMEYGMLSVLDLKDPEKAKGLFERVVGIDPNHRGALNELIMLYNDPQKIEGGLEFLKARMAAAEDNPELEYAYGKLLMENGRQSESIKYLEKATELKDIADQVFLEVAEASEAAGQIDRAVAAYQKALQIQNAELQAARAEGRSGIDFIEDRIFITRVSYARSLIAEGRRAEANEVLDGIEGRQNDPTMISLRQEAASQRRF